MFAGNWLTYGLPGRTVFSSWIVPLGRFALGTLLGIVAVSMWQQFSLSFGLDPILTMAVGLVLSAGFWLGQRWSQNQRDMAWGRTFSYLLFCLCAWSWLHPYWIDTMTTMMGVVPLRWLELPGTKLLVAGCVALLAWLVPGMLWAAALTHGIADHPSKTHRSASATALGIAFGLVLNSTVLAPLMGVYVPTLAATIFAAGYGFWLRRSAISLDVSRLKLPLSNSTKFDPELLIRIGMAFLVGGLVASEMRLVNQLMPHGAFVIFAQAAGLLTGIAGAFLIASFRQNQSNLAAWSGLLVAAASSLFIALQPSLVDFSLWMNSTLTNVVWLMIGRVVLIMATMLPFGIALVGISAATGAVASHRSIAWGTPFLAGAACATFVLGGTISSLSLMAGCSALLLLATGVLRVRTCGWSVSVRSATAGGCLLAVAFSLPIWRLNDDAFRTAKVLFSTPAFVAYRSGWNVNQLSALDDLRLIHRRENALGSLTLWRGRVAELYVREAGVPRSVLTKNSEIVPQFAPEVLQAVYSLVLADRPGRVMLLGLSGGVPLSTCLDFPVREVVCVEGDSSLVGLVRGPIAAETGIDPLSDDRVTLRQVSPELALMTRSVDPFDVILSSPPSSSMTTGAANFTSEFYERASHHLSERGLFCQRFECIDYGPEPLRIVLKSMRRAFRQVIAIETAAGEMLLFGANSDDVFIPGDLASRLELPHVLRILERSGLDWSTLLNQPAYDHEALGEVCDESRHAANSMVHGSLGAQTPLEVIRWANKQQEVQTALTTTRLTKAPYWTEPATGQPNELENEIHLSRRSRLVEWLGDSRVSLELLRRLNEVTTQQRLVFENPDAHWWEYRKTLRKQLQERPRTIVQQVKAIDEKQTLHPEDIRRRDYFVALGNAVDRKKTPTRKEIAAVEAYLEPFDPLLTYFARQEIADLLARCDEDADRELAYRLHVIFFAPTRDASVRNVAAAIETIVKHPRAVSDDATRFDALNGLIQTLRTRWETRQFINETSAKKVLDDVDQSLIAIEKGVNSLNELAASAGVSETEWANRKQVIERLLLRPLRSYRAEIKTRQDRSQMQARAIFDRASQVDSEQE